VKAGKNNKQKQGNCGRMQGEATRQIALKEAHHAALQATTRAIDMQQSPDGARQIMCFEKADDAHLGYAGILNNGLFLNVYRNLQNSWLASNLVKIEEPRKTGAQTKRKGRLLLFYNNN
jgi:hypothetical protein